MVLQKSPQRAVLWGYGPEGEKVTVYLSGPIQQKVSSVPVKEGKSISFSLFFINREVYFCGVQATS